MQYLLLQAGRGLTFQSRRTLIRENMPTPSVTNNTAASQFELQTDSGLALLKYVRRGNTLDLVHTEVPPQAQGKGLGEALARAALDFGRREKLTVTPSCRFVKAVLAKHPELAAAAAPPS